MLGWKLGVARAVGAIVFSVVIGLIMHALFRAEEQARTNAIPAAPIVAPARTLGQEVTYFASLVGILVFANWAEPNTPWGFVGLSVVTSRAGGDAAEWFSATWDYAKHGLFASPAIRAASRISSSSSRWSPPSRRPFACTGISSA